MCLTKTSIELSPQAYYNYTLEKTKKFVDHDDKISEDKISDAFEWTSETYQKAYNEVYSECTCWYCEGIMLVMLATRSVS